MVAPKMPPSSAEPMVRARNDGLRLGGAPSAGGVEAAGGGGDGALIVGRDSAAASACSGNHQVSPCAGLASM